MASRSSAVFLATVLVACGGPDPESADCTVDPATRTVRCERLVDPRPSTADDESTTIVEIVLAEGALDGAPHAIAAQTDHALTELSFAGSTIDASMLERLAPAEGHDAVVECVLVWRRVHVLDFDAYDRVEVTGEITAGADGHGHLEVAWTDPAADRASAGTFEASF